MLSDNPFIHTLKTKGKYYYYDVNRNVILNINKEIYNLLEKTELEQISQKNLNTLENMKNEGFLSSKRVKEIFHPVDNILEYYLDNKLRMITLQVTRQCNLRCEYCVYSGNYENRGHSNEVMSFITAKKGIDFLLSHSRDSKSLAVGFYGGEPLLEFELIKKCIEYAEKKCEGKDLHFTFTTNGTLFNDEILEYISQHNINILVSLDGPGDIHNQNRKFASNCRGTFDIVMRNLEYIKNNYPEIFTKINIHAVVDKRNDIGCINNFFSNDKVIRDASFSLSFVADYYSKKEVGTSEEFYENINYEYFKLFLSKIGRLDKEHISKIAIPYYEELERTYNQLVPVMELNDKMHHGGPCIPGVQRLFLNVKGEYYPCERVNEESEVMKIGDIEKGFNLDNIKNILNIGKISEEMCKSCWAIRFCGLCAAVADNSDEFSYNKKMSYCYGMRESVESKFKDICVLKEMGFDFTET